jgi:nitrogen fixation protein FixH
MAIPAERGNPKFSLVPWLFPAGLGLVVLVNMVLLWFALGTFPGVVAGNTYERGRRYNAVLQEDAAIAAMQLTVDVTFVADGGGNVVVRYRDRDGQPMAKLSVVATVSRPLGNPVRITIPLREIEPGVYRADLSRMNPGQWDVLLIADSQPVAHRTTARVVIP